MNMHNPSIDGAADGSAASIAPASQRATDHRARGRALGLGAPWIAALFVAPFAGEAYERVEYNGKLYACAHRCSITTFKDGSAHIRDAPGAWAARIEVDGGVIVDEEGKT